MSEDDLICAYCGEPVLTGTEEPEHVIPAAINGRYTMKTVCIPCNRWAGKEIDQPWLADPFVLDQRFWARVPDRRGKLLTCSPLLTGTTEDGRRVTLGPDGKPALLNSPISRSEGEVRIIAADQAAMDAAKEREKRKVEKAGKTWTPGEQSVCEDQPQIEGSFQIAPSQWERMAAKMALSFLADTQPASWRRSASAEMLRKRMREPNRPAKDVQLATSSATDSFAEKPASAIVVMPLSGQPAVTVSLMGTFSVVCRLESDSAGIDLALVSDPLDPGLNFVGTLGEVIYLRHQGLGLL